MAQKIKSGFDQKVSSDSIQHSGFPELCQVWLSQPYSKIPNNTINFPDQNIELQLLFNCSPCVFWLLDLRTLQFVYISPRISKITGFEASSFSRDGLKFLDSIMCTEDKGQNWQHTKQTWDKISGLSLEERKYFSYNNTYRVLKPDGTLVKLLEQNAVWQLDATGNITHILSIASDISQLERLEPVDSFASDTPKSLPYFTGANVMLPHSVLSKRELQILKLMAAGYNSKHIAEELFISFHTVNTHRQKMIEKTKTSNSSGVIQYARNLGLI